MYLLNSEQKVGANDLQGSMAYYGTEAAMEKMASDLGDLYTQKKNPKSTEIQNLGLPTPGMVPSLSGISYPEYTFTVPNTDANGYPVGSSGTLTTGANAGLLPRSFQSLCQ